MPAYILLVCRDLTARKQLEKYWANTPGTLVGIQVKPLSFYSKFEVLEGADSVQGFAVVEFPNFEIAKAWYEGPLYSAARKEREGAADFLCLLLDEGVVPADQRMPSVG